MKTLIIINEGWETIATYDFLIPLSQGDFVSMPDGREYEVECCMLDLSDNTLKVLVK